MVGYWAVYGVGMTVGSWAGQKVLMKVCESACLLVASWVWILVVDWVVHGVALRVGNWAGQRV